MIRLTKDKDIQAIEDRVAEELKDYLLDIHCGEDDSDDLENVFTVVVGRAPEGRPGVKTVRRR